MMILKDRNFHIIFKLAESFRNTFNEKDIGYGHQRTKNAK